jgi:sterol desaturase/sphingolipid hydroxylase (fatty acid hydroxylase superfamily)
VPVSTQVVLAIYFFFALVELWRSQLFHKPGQTRNDAIVEIVSPVILLGLTQPSIILGVNLLLGQLIPEQRGVLANIPVWAAILLFLVFDDMMQYWFHRAAHSFPSLYNLHRAHHNAHYMSLRLIFRNNILYYWLLPGIWFSAVLIYLGLGWVYVGYAIVKITIIIAAHSDVAWDRPLYEIKALSPLMWLVERTISTPSTHHAHHGRRASDPATKYKGNYGNLLFFWDVLFGTAKITRSYPEEFGVENLPPATLGQLLMWPIFPENRRPAAECALRDQLVEARAQIEEQLITLRFDQPPNYRSLIAELERQLSELNDILGTEEAPNA